MARNARELSSAGLYIIELKGLNIVRDEADAEKLRELVDKSIGDTGRLYAAAYAKNRIYLALKETDAGLSSTMRPITIGYARYFNKKYELSGKVFMGRFKSTAYESEEELIEAAAGLEELAAAADAETYEGVVEDAASLADAILADNDTETEQPKKKTARGRKRKNAKKPAKKTEKKPGRRGRRKKSEIEAEAAAKAEEAVAEAPKPTKKKKQEELPIWLL